MNQNTQKQQAADAALAYIRPQLQGDTIIGVGTGSTVNAFIDVLAQMKGRFEGAVSSSQATTERLKHHRIPVYALNDVSTLPIYVDGADEIDPHLRMIKGGGGALTQEKIVAAVAEQFICIADASKYVPVLGQFPLPIEVLPMARSYVARELVKLGATPSYRQGLVTDNGHIILDAQHLDMTDPKALESTVNQIPGVVTNGLFARRGADVLLLSEASGVKTLTR